MPALLLSLALFAGLPQQNGAADEVEAHAASLRKRLPSKFTVVVERPFVVVGDEPAERVRSRAIHTVRWAVERLRREYFPKDPAQVLEIWLLKDARSYRENARRYFDDEPTTPYGYYSPSNRALIMNISTGGGTLVHEIVHPLMEANFPDCPAWFNEGLGSLYEQSDQRDGRIIGLTNWRLAGLQQAIDANRLPSFEALLATSDSGFYGDDDAGTNYAQARYLLMYLQERGLLTKFYRLYHERYEQDPTGIVSLRSVLGLRERDMAKFEAEWKKWVLGLRFKG